MRSPLDVQRSLQRFTSLVLPDYEMRILSEAGTLKRPYATIEATTEPAMRMEAAIATREASQGFSLVAFPEPETDPYDARIKAEEVGEAIYAAFELGGVGGARAERIPLFDYEGKAANEGAAPADRTPCDYMRVNDFSVRAVQNPSDETLYSVVAAMRIGWSRAALLPEEGNIAEELRLGFDPV